METNIAQISNRVAAIPNSILGSAPTGKNTLDSIFSSTPEENKVQRARRILKGLASDISDVQLEIFVTEVECVLDTWLNLYEQHVFDGLTLKQVLKGE